MQITIASYNVHKCVGVDGIFNPERIIKVIKGCNADIIALQEIDKRFGAREGLINPYHLYHETGLHYAPIKTTKPSSFGWHGNAIFYKDMDLVEIEQSNLPGVEPRGALFAIFKKEEIYFCIVAAHFGLLHKCRKNQVKMILDILTQKYNMPAFLLGDLNDWRRSDKSALHGLSRHFSLQSRLPASFPARYPLFSLDKIYASHKNMILYTKVPSSELSRKASDHRPIIACVDLSLAS